MSTAPRTDGGRMPPVYNALHPNSIHLDRPVTPTALEPVAESLTARDRREMARLVAQFRRARVAGDDDAIGVTGERIDHLVYAMTGACLFPEGTVSGMCVMDFDNVMVVARDGADFAYVVTSQGDVIQPNGAIERVAECARKQVVRHG
jgi:hypothetical protein